MKGISLQHVKQQQSVELTTNVKSISAGDTDDESKHEETEIKIDGLDNSSNNDDDPIYDIFDQLANKQYSGVQFMYTQQTNFLAMTKTFNKNYIINNLFYCKRKKTRQYWGKCTFFELLINLAFLPLSLLFYILFVFFIIFYKLNRLFIKSHVCCFRNRQQTLVHNINNCVVTSQTSFPDKLDFAIHRFFPYVDKFSFGVMSNFAHYLTGGYKYLPLVTDDYLYTLLTLTPIARELKYDFNQKTISLDLDPDIHNITTYPGCNVSVIKSFCIDCTKRETSIIIRGNAPSQSQSQSQTQSQSNPKLFDAGALIAGHVEKIEEFKIVKNGNDGKNYKYKNDAGGGVDDESRRLWDLSKAHLQCVLTWYAGAWMHNWVHFHFLDICSKWHKKIVPRNSVLGNLLGAHLRYISEINLAGMGENPNNPQSRNNCIDKHSPHKVQINSSEQFMNQVASNASKHYLNIDSSSGKVISINYDNFPPEFVRVRINGNISGNNGNNGDSAGDDIRGLVPYLDMLTDYYVVIYDFIDNLYQSRLLENDMLDQFIKHIETQGMPGLSNIEAQTVLSVLIWTSSVVHTCDHTVYAKIFKTYGLFSTTKKWNNNHEWTDIIQSGLRDSQYRVFRTQCFIDLFGFYYKSWFWANDTLTNKYLYKQWKNIHCKTNYDRRLLNKFHSKYLDQLNQLNSQWDWIIDANDIAASCSF